MEQRERKEDEVVVFGNGKIPAYYTRTIRPESLALSLKAKTRVGILFRQAWCK